MSVLFHTSPPDNSHLEPRLSNFSSFHFISLCYLTIFLGFQHVPIEGAHHSSGIVPVVVAEPEVAAEKAEGPHLSQCLICLVGYCRNLADSDEESRSSVDLKGSF